MSGRLILLPKKSYCPWKPENVERVLRDERLAKEREVQEEEKSRERIISQLKANKGDTSASASTQQQQHVNLFAQEEQAMLHESLLLTAGLQQRARRGGGVVPVRLGDSVKPADDKPFYVRQRSIDADDSRKADIMDPMKMFVQPRSSSKNREFSTAEKSTEQQEFQERRHNKRSRIKHRDSDSESDSSSSESNRQKKRRKKERRRRRRSRKEKRRRHEHDDKSTKNNKESMEELRKRRLDRELHESRREAALMLSTSRQDRGRRYQNQYNPSLSRK